MQAVQEISPKNLPEKERAALTKVFFNLMNHWDLTLQEQANLLGWDYREKRSKIDAMRRGTTLLENDADKLDRVIHLINIHKCLRVLFPADRDAVYSWVKVPRERFGGYSALDVMLENGSYGIAAVRHYLEHERTR